MIDLIMEYSLNAASGLFDSGMLRSILDVSQDSVHLFDTEGYVLFANRAALDRFGVTLESIIGQSFMVFLPPAVAASRLALLQRCVATGEVLHFVDQRAGMSFEHQFYPLVDATGRVTQVATFSREISERIKREEMLRRSEERLALAQQAAELGLFDYAFDEGMLTADRRLYRLWGIPYETGVTYSQALASLHPEDQAAAEACLRSALDPQGDHQFRLEIRVSDAGGEPRSMRWLLVTGRVFFVDSRPQRVVGMVADISDLKAAQRDRDQTLQRLEMVLESTGLATYDANLLTGDAHIDRRYRRLVGYDLEQPATTLQSWSESIHPHDWPQVLQMWQEVDAGTRNFFDISYRLRHQSGDWMWIQDRGRVVERDAAGHAAQILGTVQDIRERKMLEYSLSEHDRQLRAIIDALPVMVSYLDTEMRYVFNNRMYELCYGLSSEALRGRTVFEVIGDAAAARALPFIRRALAGESVTFDVRAPFQDGLWHELQVSYVPDGTVDSGVKGVFVVVTDLTVARQTDAELQQLRAAMENMQEHQLAKQTIAAVAHELNQPLNAASTFSEAALRMLHGPFAADQVAQVVTRIATEIQRAGGVLHELLTSFQRQAIPAKPTDLNQLVQHALELFRKDLAEEGEILVIELDPLRPRVLADRVAVEKVLINLLRNAYEACVGHMIPMEPCIKVRTTIVEDMALVTVTDRGKGLSPAALRNLFQPFNSTKPDGTGMGLAISRNLIELLGGRLWYAPGAPGAVFHFSLPLVSFTP